MRERLSRISNVRLRAPNHRGALIRDSSVGHGEDARSIAWVLQLDTVAGSFWSLQGEGAALQQSQQV
jgi:hypothetical protein